VRRLKSLVVAACILASTVLALATQAGQPASVRRIAIFGSSVANGTGDPSGQGGYAGLLRSLLEPRGWEVVNRSRGGDNTRTLMSRFAPGVDAQPGTTFLLPVQPGYVVIALSLGNEGIRTAEGAAAKEAIADQFTRGLEALVERSRSAKIVPIVTLCYTRNDFTEVEYGYTRRVNAAINQWDVPSVNFLGAVDDGAGKWVNGFWWDSLHPNASGHAELATTFVPSLFDALERGRPAPRRPSPVGFARIEGGALTFSPDAPMHPFAFGVTLRTAGDGTIARVTGTTLLPTTSSKTMARTGEGAVTIPSTTLNPAGGAAATLGIRNGVWTYTSSTGDRVASAVKADAAWHQLLVSHYTARGESLFFVDGVLAGRAMERFAPTGFAVGGPNTERRMDARDVLIYRSALNADEAAALWKGGLPQASLEVYAPLAERHFVKGLPVENRAQSLAELKLETGSALPGIR
jgi:lysophospholipase L1-like esterase